MKLIYSLVLCALAFSTATAQDMEKFLISGKTTEMDMSDQSEKNAAYVSYRVYAGDSLIDAGSSSYRGNYNIALEFGQQYEIVFMEERYVSKKIELDLTDAGSVVKKKGYRFKMDVTLFEADDHSLYDFLQDSPYVTAYLDGSRMKVDNGQMKLMANKIDKVYIANLPVADVIEETPALEVE